MSYLLKVLPTTVKTKLAKFLYADAIFINRFLQDRDDDFYAKYLEELQADKIPKGAYMIKAGNQPEYVYFIMSGVILNETSQRFFESGQMINHDNILNRSSIACDYVAHTDVGVLKYTKETFLQILEQFPEIEDNVKTTIKEKKEYLNNNKFLKQAIISDKVRKAIVKNYYDIIDEEKSNFKKANKSLAIKLNQSSKEEREDREPNVMYRSNKEKKRDRSPRKKSKKKPKVK